MYYINNRTFPIKEESMSENELQKISKKLGIPFDVMSKAVMPLPRGVCCNKPVMFPYPNRTYHCNQCDTDWMLEVSVEILSKRKASQQSEWSKQDFSMQPTESDWEIILQQFEYGNGLQFLRALKNNGNSPISMRWFKARDIWHESTISSILAKFRNKNLPYKIKSFGQGQYKLYVAPQKKQ